VFRRAGFGIVGMPADADHLQFRRTLLGTDQYRSASASIWRRDGFTDDLISSE